MNRRAFVLALMALAATLWLQGCANSPPLIAPALLAPASGNGQVFSISYNALSNYGKSGFEDTAMVERSDGSMVRPTYENSEWCSIGNIWPGQYGFLAVYAANMQLQAYGGLRWQGHAALGYFPTFTLSGKHMLHGIQLDLNGFDKAFLSASLYEENFPSILGNPAFGEPGPVKTYAVSALVLSLPWRVGPGVVWVIPNWRMALSHQSLMRFGADFAYSISMSGIL